jgi:hypothetical protein
VTSKKFMQLKRKKGGTIIGAKLTKEMIDDIMKTTSAQLESGYRS